MLGSVGGAVRLRAAALLPRLAVRCGRRHMNLMPALREVVQLDLLAKEPEETIREIWQVRHSEDPERVGAVLQAADFNDLRKRAMQHPTFIFKVPRKSHFTALVSNFPTVMVNKPFTCLFSTPEEFRQSAHSCSPALAVNFYTEFASTKGVVLVRGTVLPGVELSREDASRLLGLLLRYYAGDAAAGRSGFSFVGGTNFELVRQFNSEPHRFDLDGYFQLHSDPTTCS